MLLLTFISKQILSSNVILMGDQNGGLLFKKYRAFRKHLKFPIRNAFEDRVWYGQKQAKLPMLTGPDCFELSLWHVQKEKTPKSHSDIEL